jgi:peptidoglycan/xylan/chitin deacetylase (PgdA/CDA1 family)
LIILCYHQATGENLRDHLLYLRRHYRLLHLETALEELYTPSTSDSRKRDQRTPLVVTFDDGYHDNYTNAFALACELQVPITIFLVLGYIESGCSFWWQEGERLVSHARASEITIGNRTYHLDNLKDRKGLALAIENRLRFASSIQKREEFLISIREVLEGSSQLLLEEKAISPLSWREVQTMEESVWISFGAHTMNHPILAYLTDPAEVQYEVSESRKVLERQLGHPVHAFAYPVGQLEHIGRDGLCAVQNAGFRWAVTTIHGANTPQSDPYLLHRIVVDVDQHWLSVAAKASGIWDFFTGLYRMPIMLIQKLFFIGSRRRATL